MIFKKVELAKIERDAPEAYQSLAKFYQTHGTASFYFLCHVALPLFFRLDWLHHLWANFRGDIAQKIRQDVSYHTIADVLQTPFLATVGKETYELENTVRDFLLSELESEFGEAHLHKLATFLYQYADKCVPKGYEQEAYHLSAWSVKNPQEATRIVADSLQNLFNKPNPATDHAEHTRLLFVLQSIASPAQDKTPYNAIEKIAQRNYDLLNEEASQQKYPIVTQQQAGKNTIEFKVPQNILEGLKIQDRATPENENIIPEAIQIIEKMFGAMEEVSIESIGDKKNKGAYSINEKGEVIALALREKGIKEIDFLTHFPHVEKLYLSENKIRDIVPLESLVNLTYLGLKDNLVMDVTSIQSLSNLVHLGLKDNKITYIPPDFLTYLPRLEQLFLTGNDIANIPITINLMKSNVLDVLKKHFDSLRNKRKKIIIEKEKKAERANMDAQSNNLDDYFQQASQSFGSNNNNVVLEEPTAYKSDFLPTDFEGKDEIVLPPYTQSLDLSGILIDESIVELSQLPNLTYLKLSGMELTDLSFLTILQERETKFEYLEILDLSNNALASFPAQYLDLLPNLKELYLFGNVLPELPEEVVRVEGNCLAYFKQDISYAKILIKEAKEKGLTTLDLGNLGLTSLEDLPELFELEKLEILQLSGSYYDWDNNKFVLTNNKGKENCIKTTPTALHKLRNLKKLYLRCIGLESLFILNRFENKRLKVLDLAGNPFDNTFNGIIVKSGIKTILALDELCLGNTDTNKLPHKYFYNNLEDTIRYLDVSEVKGVNLKELEKIVNRFTNLEKINLNKNKIQNINFLKNKGKLVSLRLEFNNLKHISLDLLESLPNLQELYLQGNPIENIPENIFNNEKSCLTDLKKYLTSK